MGQVAAEPEAAVGAARRTVESGKASVVFERLGDGAIQLGADQIEGTGAAELLAFGLEIILGDFDSYHGHG